MTEGNETTAIGDGELTVQDILDDSNAAAAPYRTILDAWGHVLNGSEGARAEPITVQWAIKICGAYSEVFYSDMPAYKTLYFDRLDQLREILRVEIAEDAESLNQLNAEEDRTYNAEHYLNILIDWQKQFMQWELEWVPDGSTAGIEVATLSELHSMFFGPTGLTGLLDQINFEITDEDRDYLASELQSLINDQKGGSSE